MKPSYWLFAPVRAMSGSASPAALISSVKGGQSPPYIENIGMFEIIDMLPAHPSIQED
jgi:hypothetical protein